MGTLRPPPRPRGAGLRALRDRDACVATNAGTSWPACRVVGIPQPETSLGVPEPCESESSPSASAARRARRPQPRRAGQGPGPQAARRLSSSTRTGSDLEDVPDAAYGGLAQDDLEEDAGATDDQREDHDREVLQQDA